MTIQRRVVACPYFKGVCNVKGDQMRIGHISDFHLRDALPGSSAVATRRSREMPEKIALALDQFRAEGVDWVAVTGDLVDHPFNDMHSPENLERGEADLQLVRSLLERVSCPVFVLYGNHDHPLLFRRVFNMQSEGVDVGDFRVFCFYDEEGADHVPVRVGAELERFDRALSDEGPKQIHLQHYLVHPEHNEGYPHTYGTAGWLKQSMQCSGQVHLLLSGHYHPGALPQKDGGIHYAVAPAFCEAPHRFAVYECDAHRVQTRWLQVD